MASNTTLSKPLQWLIDWVRGAESDSGVSVTIDSALGYAPVWNAVSKISGHVGVAPLNLHRKLDGGGAEIAESHPAYRLMKTRPNEIQTAIVFKQQLMMHALLTGNGRAAIVRRGGFPVELVPLLPSQTHSCLVEGKKWHIVKLGCDGDRCEYIPGSSGWFRDGEFWKFPDRDVFHIPGLGYDGISGLSLINVAKNSFGLGLAAQKAGANSFKNGSRPGLVITPSTNEFRDERSAREFLEDFNTYHTGVANAGKAGLLRPGMSIEVLPSLSAQDAQWVEQRRFERQETALFFLLEQILGDDSSVSYNSLEMKNQAYLTNCLSPWLVKWEQECDSKLLGDRAQKDHYFKFNTGGLLKADFKSTTEALSLLVSSTIMNRNEARAKLDLNPVEGGDEFFNPNTTPGDAPSGTQEDDDSMSVEDANKYAIVSRMRHLIGVESKRVIDAADASKRINYRSWLNTYYKKWTKTLADAVKEFGGDTEIAGTHCEESYRQLLELCGSVPKDGLQDAVTKMVSNWQDRAEEMADRILREVIHA